MPIVLLAPEIIPIIIALAALLVVYAYRTLFQALLETIAAYVPLIGNVVAASIDVMLADIERRATPWADAAVTPIGRAIAAGPVTLTALGFQIIACLWAIVAFIERTAINAANGAVGAATGSLAALLASIQASVSLMTNQLVPALQASILSVADQARLRIDALAAEVAAIPASIDGLIADALTAALAGVNGAIAAAEARAIYAAQSIEAGVRDYVLQQIAIIQAALGAQLTALRDQVAGLVDELRQTIPGLRTQIGEIELAIPLATAATATVAEALRKYLEECGDPLCDTFKPDIPNIQGAFQLIETGLLTAWLVDAINDPNGAAARADTVVNGPVNAAADVIRSVARAA